MDAAAQEGSVSEALAKGKVYHMNEGASTLPGPHAKRGHLA